MADEKKYPSTFTLDNYSSTITLANNEVKIPVGSKESISEKEYDPYANRQIEHPNSFFGALIHVLKSSLGTGILAIPMAFRHAGLVVGLIGTLVVGILCTHTIHILVTASQKLCVVARVPSLGYSETAEASFKYGPPKVRGWSRFVKNFADIALVLTYYSGNAVYVVFISDTLKQVIDYFYTDAVEYGKELYMLGLLLPLILFCQIRPLKFLVPLSAIANVTLLTAFGITFYYIFKGIGDVDVKERDLVKSIDGLPKFFSTLIFAIEGVGAVMPVENSMLKQQFLGCPGVLNVAMIFVVSMYSMAGFFGYWVFGEDTQAAITSNLPLETVSQVAKACISTAVFFTFMLQFYIPMEITWKKLSPMIAEKWHNAAQVAIRSGAVIIIVGVAASVPNLATIIELVGAIFFSTLGLLIPAVIDTVINWETNLGKFNWRLYKNLCVGVFSLFALFAGSFYAIYDAVNGTD